MQRRIASITLTNFWLCVFILFLPTQSKSQDINSILENSLCIYATRITQDIEDIELSTQPHKCSNRLLQNPTYSIETLCLQTALPSCSLRFGDPQTQSSGLNKQDKLDNKLRSETDFETEYLQQVYIPNDAILIASNIDISRKELHYENNLNSQYQDLNSHNIDTNISTDNGTFFISEKISFLSPPKECSNQLFYNPTITYKIHSQAVFLHRSLPSCSLENQLQAQNTNPSQSDNETEEIGSAPSLQSQEILRQYNPGIAILTPSAFGSSLGNISLAFGVNDRARFADNRDGAAGLNFGLGDPINFVGVDIGVTVSDLSDFARGSVSFKIHRTLSETLAIAVGVNEAFVWGGRDDILDVSPYIVATKVFNLKDNYQKPLSSITTSIGVGKGRYRPEIDIFQQRDSLGVFGSVALRVVNPLNVFAEWSGQDLSFGLSLVPFRHIPFTITSAITDVTGNAGDGTRVLVAASYRFKF